MLLPTADAPTGISQSALSEVSRIVMLRDSAGARTFDRFYVRPEYSTDPVRQIELVQYDRNDHVSVRNANLSPHFEGYNVLLCDEHVKYYDQRKMAAGDATAWMPDGSK